MKLSLQYRLNRVVSGYKEFLKMFIEAKTLRYASVCYALIMVTYALTMANVCIKLNKPEFVNYYLVMTAFAVTPLFIFSMFGLMDFMESEKKPTAVNFVKNASYSLFSVGFAFNIYFLLTTSGPETIMFAFCSIAWLASYAGLVIRGINIKVPVKIVETKKRSLVTNNVLTN